MSNFRNTVQELMDAHNARDTQRILRDYIIQETRYFQDEWEAVVEAAKNSTRVNHDHPNSRKMRSVSQSQILDRMNVHALAHLIRMMNAADYSNALHHFKCVFEDDNLEDITYWPFAVHYDVLDKLDDVFISRDADDVTPDTDGEAEAEPEAEPSGAYNVQDDIASAANVLLRAATNGEMDDLQALLDEVVQLRKKPDYAPLPQVQASGAIPFGAPIRKNAQEVFGITDTLLDFDINTYEWDGDNPLVPRKDDNYIFNVDNLHDVLWARENGENAWLTGHTGTGKSTFVAQVCAYTGYMMVRVNMDSAIERPDFVGSMAVMTDDDGNTVTRFKDGILPKAMQQPCVLLLDEIDAVRADIAYVMQPVLEGQPLRLLEDGGRVVHPHPDFHIVATANTTGVGDSTGMYASAVKVQSRALINRFSTFVYVQYLALEQEMQLVRNAAPNISDEAMALIQDFVSHYRLGFQDGTIATPISPRNTTTIGKYVSNIEGRVGAEDAVRRALNMNVMLTVDEGDAIAVTGIMDRITSDDQPF